MSALIFLDTETTGLSLDDDIWEFAAVRREEDGRESRTHLLICHDYEKCQRLPEPFLSDHMRRFDHGGGYSEEFAAQQIAALFHDRPHVVGAVPNFDTERLALLLRRHGYEPGWHYHLIDVENLAVGFLVSQWRDDPDSIRPLIGLPWDSDDLSRACDVEPPGEGERHTAMGDVHWAMALYDTITGGAL